MITCREVTELVTDYLEGRLSRWDRVRFQFHLGMCRHCRAYLRQMRSTIRTAGALRVEPPPPEVAEDLMRRFREWKRTS